MAGIVKDPSRLTKDNLRKALIKYNVPLPAKTAKKDEYVSLYKQFLINRPQKYDFSSDEEVVIVSQKSTRTAKRQSLYSKKKGVSMAFEDKLEEVEELSDVQLRKELIKRGQNIGPVTGTTRRLYQKKLVEFMLQPDKKEKQVEKVVEEEEEEEEEEDEYSDEDELEKPIADNGDAQIRSRLTQQKSTVTTQTTPRTPTTPTVTTRRVTRQSLANSTTTTTSSKSETAEQMRTQQQSSTKSSSKPCCRFAVPVWAQILLFLLLAGFIILVWYNFETLPALPWINNTPAIGNGKGSPE